MIKLTFPYPVSANVYWRTTNRGITFVSPKAIEYRKAVKSICDEAGVTQMDGYLAVFMELCAKRPKKWEWVYLESGDRYMINSATGKEPRAMDLSNSIKVAEDAMQGCVYENDKQVRALSIKYGEPVPGGCLNVMVVKA